MAGEGVLAATKGQLLVGDATLPATMSVTTATGLVTTVAVVHAVAMNTVSSATAPASPLGRLIWRTRPARRQRPVLARSQRRDPDLTTNTIGVFRKSRGRKTRPGPRGPRRPGARSDVQHAVAADEGLSTLGRCPTSRGRAAHLMIGRPPRGPGSATIDHHLTAFAAERQGVRRTGADQAASLRRSKTLPTAGAADPLRRTSRACASSSTIPGWRSVSPHREQTSATTFTRATSVPSLTLRSTWRAESRSPPHRGHAVSPCAFIVSPLCESQLSTVPDRAGKR